MLILKNLILEEFIQKYKEDITCIVSFKHLFKHNPIIANYFITQEHQLNKKIYFSINYEKGDWLNGQAKRYKINKNKNVILYDIPAVEYKDKIFLLDKNHRVEMYQPGCLVLDVILLNDQTKKFVGETLNNL